ncbi:glycosyltransferase family protein [Chitinophaga cymbidii]|uniref:Glycosyl transferase family 1 domain-containing protein n=1 Tax=Chitinophaga cymbidii TaxID=1096750 RepID=A0A512RIQ1_9BACT|nr:glycosyltransferase family 4 protein [Chitinophaga cymbidii]GEP95550.1 hypothetical protein CCY01nite_18100 [Chitinophaga cymbidii]
MRILSLVNKQSGCCYHRVKLPVTYLINDGLIQGVPGGLSFEESLKHCDVLFYNRVPTGYTIEQILQLRAKHGFKIVVDMDDFWRLYPGHFLEKIWEHQGLERQFVKNLTAADAVTCTSDRLREKVIPYNRNVHVIPNALPFGEMQFYSDRAPAERMRFIYAGGTSHFWDLRLLRPTMDKLSRDKFTGEIVLAGIAPGVDIYRKMIDTVSARGKLRHFRTITYQPLDSYMDLYNDGDVALAPLVGNEFNSCKSNLKVLEAGSKKMPIIVSNTGPYRDDPCPHLMRVDTPSEWYKWIRWCEQNPNHVIDIGQALHTWVQERYDIRKINNLRLEVFNSVA